MSNQYLYFIGAENGLVKIGYASNYEARLGQLCNSSPVSLQPLAVTRGGRLEERAYHDRFRAYRHHGEWHYLTDEIEAEIDRINYEQTPRHTPIRFRGYAPPLTLTKETLPW